MPFSAHDLRYKPEQSYPLLYAYLHSHAQRYLGPLKYDANEVDLVVGHVIEQLVRLGVFGSGDTTSVGALDSLSDAQFYAFLSRCVRNKAIDRLRKHRPMINNASEFIMPAEGEGLSDPFEHAVESLWGTAPFATPEEIALHLASQQEQRAALRRCIMALRVAPHQLHAILKELRSVGADALLQSLLEELHISHESTPDAHESQQRDHAHKKLRHCLQQQSTHLIVRVAFRLTTYGGHADTEHRTQVNITTLTGNDLSEKQVRETLSELAAKDLVSWDGDDIVSLTPIQRKRLARLYREE